MDGWNREWLFPEYTFSYRLGFGIILMFYISKIKTCNKYEEINLKINIKKTQNSNGISFDNMTTKKKTFSVLYILRKKKRLNYNETLNFTW